MDLIVTLQTRQTSYYLLPFLFKGKLNTCNITSDGNNTLEAVFHLEIRKRTSSHTLMAS